MPEFIKNILRRKVALVVIAVVLAAGAYFGYRALNPAAAARYVTAQVQKGTIVVSVTGSGQVSESNQIDLKPKVSGDVIYVAVSDGQSVDAGALIAKLDDTDAQKAVRDAEVNVQSAELSLEKLRGPAGLAVPKNKDQAQQDLKTAYDDGFNTVANAFLDLPSIVTGVDSILYGDNISKGQWNGNYFSDEVQGYDATVVQFRDDAFAKYQIARTDYDQTFSDYKAANRSSDPAVIEALISESYDTTRAVAEAVKSASNLIQFYEDKLTEKNLKPAAIADTYLSSLSDYTGKTNTHLVNLLQSVNTIKSDKDAVTNADLDVQSQELSAIQRQNALQDAKDTLADYSILAPFGGVVAKVNVKKADPATSGTIIATLITKQKLAQISLNEVDAAKIKVGQKATLTFDAIDGLSISGQVTEIDTVGTVTQGVVTYGVQIGFDTQDARVKSGMSINAAIVTDVKQDVLTVPNSAVKTQGGTHYVEIFGQKLSSQGSALGGQGIASAIPPRQQAVEIGISDDTSTEIVSGLNEGDEVVVRTITTAQSTSAAPQAPSLFGTGGGGRGLGGGGGGGGGGGAARTVPRD